MEPREIVRGARRKGRAVARRARTEVDRLRSRSGRADPALVDLITHDEQARTLGARARQTVETELTRQRCVEQLRQALLRAVDERPCTVDRLG